MKTEYCFNIRAFNNLHKLFKIQKQDWYEVCGMSKPTYCRYMRQNDFPLKNLINICNEKHISIRYLILSTDNDDEYNKPLFCWYIPEEWEDIYIDFQKFAEAWGITCGKKMPSTAMLQTYGNITHMAVDGWLRQDNSTVTVQKYIKFCNIFDIDPFSIIVEPKEDLQKKFNVLQQLYEKQDEELKRLREENRRLQKKIKNLDLDMENLITLDNFPKIAADNEETEYGLSSRRRR